MFAGDSQHLTSAVQHVCIGLQLMCAINRSRMSCVRNILDIPTSPMVWRGWCRLLGHNTQSDIYFGVPRIAFHFCIDVATDITEKRRLG